MSRNTNAESISAESQTAQLVLLPAFLADLPHARIGEYVTLHTARRSYFGRLLEINQFYALLEAESDSLDGLIHLRINIARIEAVELLRD